MNNVKGIKMITLDDLPLSDVSQKTKEKIHLSNIKNLKDVSVFLHQKLTWHTNAFNFQCIPIDFFNMDKNVVRDKIDDFIDNDIDIENLLCYCFQMDEDGHIINIYMGVPRKVRETLSQIKYTCTLCKKEIICKPDELPDVNYCIVDNKCIYLCDDCKDVHECKKIGD